MGVTVNDRKSEAKDLEEQYWLIIMIGVVLIGMSLLVLGLLSSSGHCC